MLRGDSCALAVANYYKPLPQRPQFCLEQVATPPQTNLSPTTQPQPGPSAGLELITQLNKKSQGPPPPPSQLAGFDRMKSCATSAGSLL